MWNQGVLARLCGLFAVGCEPVAKGHEESDFSVGGDPVYSFKGIE